MCPSHCTTRRHDAKVASANADGTVTLNWGDGGTHFNLVWDPSADPAGSDSNGVEATSRALQERIYELCVRDFDGHPHSQDVPAPTSASASASAASEEAAPPTKRHKSSTQSRTASDYELSPDEERTIKAAFAAKGFEFVRVNPVDRNTYDDSTQVSSGMVLQLD